MVAIAGSKLYEKCAEDKGTQMRQRLNYTIWAKKVSRVFCHITYSESWLKKDKNEFQFGRIVYKFIFTGTLEKDCTLYAPCHRRLSFESGRIHRSGNMWKTNNFQAVKVMLKSDACDCRKKLEVGFMLWRRRKIHRIVFAAGTSHHIRACSRDSLIFGASVVRLECGTKLFQSLTDSALITICMSIVRDNFSWSQLARTLHEPWYWRIKFEAAWRTVGQEYFILWQIGSWALL